MERQGEKPRESAVDAAREVDRQDIVNAIVQVRGTDAGALANGDGLDWDIAHGLNELGFMILPPVTAPDADPPVDHYIV